MALQQAPQRVKLPFGQIVNMLGRYAKAKVVEQIKTVTLIVAYLVLFQLIVLNIPVANALVVAMGSAWSYWGWLSLWRGSSSG